MIVRMSYVSCDGEGSAEDPCPAGEIGFGARDARNLARQDGWVRRGGKDLCPNCKRKQVAA